MATTQNYGLIRTNTGQATLLPIPIPTLPPDYILIRTATIALNPTDWTTLDAPGDNGTLVGCDYSGIIEAIGPAVTRPWKKGDRVAGFAHGGNDLYPEKGAFTRYVIAKGDLQMRVPEGVRDEAAATMGVAVTSAGFGLFRVLGLAYPGIRNSGIVGDGDDGDGYGDGDRKAILIYGGSTATGAMAIQLAKLSGLKVVTTCSPRNFGLVKERGADVVFDYRDKDVGKRINAATDNDLGLVFDTVNTVETVAICAEAFGSRGGQFVNLLDVPCPRSDVTSQFFLGYDVSGEEYIFENEKYPANPEAFKYAAEFLPIAEKLWKEGKLKPHPQRVESSGLRGALEGLQILREGRYSGEKLVYRVDETDWPQP